MTDDQYAALDALEDLHEISFRVVDHTMIDGKMTEVPGFGFSVTSQDDLTDEQWALVRRIAVKPFEPKAARRENGRLTQWFRFVTA